MTLRRITFIYLLALLVVSVIVSFVVMHANVLTAYEKSYTGAQEPNNSKDSNAHPIINEARNEIEFNSKKDSLVFFHTQKTSGTSWDLRMLKNLITNETGKWERACSSQQITQRKSKMSTYAFLYECRRTSSNSSWIFSWHERHWGWACGLHPTLDDLKSCIFAKHSHANKHDFKFISMLREPVRRFISEWKHIKNYRVVWVFDRKPLTASQTCLRGIKLQNKRI
jgi:hypothetical protein